MNSLLKEHTITVASFNTKVIQIKTVSGLTNTIELMNYKIKRKPKTCTISYKLVATTLKSINSRVESEKGLSVTYIHLELFCSHSLDFFFMFLL